MNTHNQTNYMPGFFLQDNKLYNDFPKHRAKNNIHQDLSSGVIALPTREAMAKAHSGELIFV